ncbi:SsuA/THI5-like domain-containing protein [Bordetella sputigena]|uniref:ABC transporter substrate-binding protein n=1 Tax=Bordetella sputigena TaxID=1416810 RepID=UPI0039EE42B4
MKTATFLQRAILGAAICLGLASGGSAAAAEKLKLVFPTSSATLALPYLVAQKKGWLDAEAIQVSGDSNAVRALLAGTGDVAIVGAFNAFAAAGEGAKFKAIGTWQGINDYELVVASDIGTMKDIEGKIFAGTGPGGPPEEFGKLLFRKNGVDASKVRFIAVSGGHANIVQALMAGRASAGMVNTLSAVTGVRTGKIKILVSMGSAYPQIGYVYNLVRNDRIDDPALKPRLQQLTLAGIKASRYIMDHPDEAVQILVERYPDLDKGLATDVVQELNRNKVWGVNGGISKEQVAATLDVFKSTGMLKADVDPAQMFDYRFIDAALKEVGGK